MELFKKILKKQPKSKPVKDVSSTRVRAMGVVKLLSGVTAFIVIATSGLGRFATIMAFGLILIPCWKCVPEIATGVSFARTSERARGMTILLGLGLFLLLAIVIFEWLRRASAA